MMTTQRRIKKLKDAEALIRDVLNDMDGSSEVFRLVASGATYVYRAHSQLKKANEKKAKKRPIERQPAKVARKPKLNTPFHIPEGSDYYNYPTEPIKPISAEQEKAYYAALELVARIDEDLTRGVRHYRTKAGLLLETLDQVIQAIIDDNLLWPDEQEQEVLWVRPEGVAV